MGLIDFAPGKPDSDRVETTEADGTASSTDVAVEPETEAESASQSGGRLGRVARVTGALAIAAVGLLTLEKLRNSRAEDRRTDDPFESRLDDSAEGRVDDPSE